jgi:hypothetical protein
MVVFIVKKGTIARNHQWQERKDIIFQARYGISPTGAIRESFCSNFKDRRRWLQWLYEAKKRYGLVILNYAVTSNHIHLLVVGGNERDVFLIPLN